jgi:hypothetical protein
MRSGLILPDSVEFPWSRATLTSPAKCIMHLKVEYYLTLEGRSHEDASSLEEIDGASRHGFAGQLHVDGDISLGKGRRRFKLRQPRQPQLFSAGPAFFAESWFAADFTIQPAIARI